MFLTSVCGVSPAEAIAIATGNTARAHGLDVGVLAEGRPADLVICAPVGGSSGKTVADAIAHGDLPGISHVLIDGEMAVAGRSRQTPPPARPAGFACCNIGWMTKPNGFPRAQA
jgi:enamidase